MRIAFVSLATPLKRASWSGTPWYTYREICRRFDDVQLIDSPRTDAVVESLSALQRYGLSVRQRRALSRYHGLLTTKRVREIQPDVILSVGASHKILNVVADCPIVHVSDGMFGTMAGYYEKFGRFTQLVRRDAHADHQRLLNRTNMILFASEWARASAVELYDFPHERTRVIPFGANIDDDPGFRPRNASGPLVILFIGYDWKRKGGDIVLSAWKELKRRIDNTELHIVGCSPSEAAGLPGVKVHGRLNKGNAAHRQLLEQLFDRASIFFMPSRQEAYGMVFCEAAAYGLPSVATNTGGVSTSVAANETGLLLPPGSSPEAFADEILRLWNDKVRYQNFSIAARTRYETELNWRSWGQSVSDALGTMMAQLAPGSSTHPPEHIAEH